jgi:hypothetical protein
MVVLCQLKMERTESRRKRKKNFPKFWENPLCEKEKIQKRRNEN